MTLRAVRPSTDADKVQTCVGLDRPGQLQLPAFPMTPTGTVLCEVAYLLTYTVTKSKRRVLAPGAVVVLGITYLVAASRNLKYQ